jgi:hypothetical protein
MSWVDAKKYTHYHSLERAIPIVVAETEQWMANNKDIVGATVNTFGVNSKEELTEIPVTPEEYKHMDDWRVLPMLYNKTWNTDVFKKSHFLLAPLPGLYQALVNLVVPGGKIAKHRDTGNWDKIEEHYGHRVDGYSVVLNLHIAMKDKKEKTVGMEVGGIEKYPLTGEIVAFDGRTASHSMWNLTNEWRITAVLDFDKRVFNVD